jgi:hypothetical protein
MYLVYESKIHSVIKKNKNEQQQQKTQQQSKQQQKTTNKQKQINKTKQDKNKQILFFSINQMFWYL